MKFSYLFIIALLTLALSAFGVAQETTNTTGLVGTVSGLSNISVGNLYGGIGVQQYITDNGSIRASFGGTFAKGSSDYTVSGAFLYDLMTAGDGALYLGGGLVYSHPVEGSTSTDFIVPIGARFPIFKNVTLGFEYVTTVEFDPTVVNVGGTSGASGLLTVWF